MKFISDLTISKGLKLYIHKLIKQGKVEFEEWKNGFGLRSVFNPQSYPKQDVVIYFGGKTYYVTFKNAYCKQVRIY
jgi:hypothetical protein